MKHISQNTPARPLRVAAIVLLVATLAGCSTVRGWFGGQKDEAKAALEPAPLVEFTPTVEVHRLWTARAGKGEDRIGVGQGPAIADGRVYAAAVHGGVHAYGLHDGAQIWHYSSKLALSGGPGVGEGLVVVGSLEGDVIALDAETGTERWSAKVGNEVIAAPAIGQGMVVVRSNDGRVYGLDAGSGERRWMWATELPALTVRGNGDPVLGPGVVFVGQDDGVMLALGLADGRPLWEQMVGMGEGRTELERMADVDGTPVLDNVTLFASSYEGRTVAIEAPTGRPLWASESGGPAQVGVSSYYVVVADPRGTVWGLDKRSGSAMWQQPGLARRNPGPVAIHGEYAVTADFQGYVHWMRLENGEFAARTRAGRAAVKGPLVAADGVLVVQNVDGALSAYRLGQ